ncbi:MAG: portal protein [Candidatus Omnitrophota bacterium]
MAINVESVIRRADRLKVDRGTLESHWQECAKYCLPKRAYITRTKTLGEKVDTDIYDSTGIQAALILAAGLHSYLTNPASKWFALRAGDVKLAKDGNISKWLRDSEDGMYDVLNSSNFAQQVHENYLDLVVFGTSCLYEEEDIEDVVRFYCRSLGEVYVEEDGKERIKTLFRRFLFTAFQAYSEWGDNAGQKVKDAIDGEKFNEKFEFLHAITPRYIRDSSKSDAMNMAFTSAYIEISGKHLIKEGGYHEFPFFVPRFTKESGEQYGSSPAMVSLPDIKMLNKMSYTLIRAAQKIVDPPLQLPHDGFVLPIRLGPAALNFNLKSGMDPNAKIEPIHQAGNIPVGMEMEQERRDIIRRNFFVDLFLMLAENPNMTATEVMQRVQEKMLILAPVLGRLMNELLDPVIERTFNIMLRGGYFNKPVPEALIRSGYSIEYTSPLARAQKGEEMKNNTNFMLTLGEISKSIPSVIDKLNGDAMVDESARFYNVSPTIIRDDVEVKKIREARAAAQQQEMEMAAAEKGVQIAKAGAEAQAITKEKGK